MQVKNCVRCGGVFVYAGNRMCPDCLGEEEELFERVELYLKEHPGANLEKVAEGTGICKDTILDFIRKGRLVAFKAEALFRCEICGARIDQGRICSDCAGELTRGMNQRKSASLASSGSDQSTNKMHIADILQRRGRLR